VRADDLSLFQSPLLPGEELRFEGKLDGEHLAEGLLCAGWHVVGYVEEGVASLCAPNLNWRDDDLAKLKEGNWIQRNRDWWRSTQPGPVGSRFVREFVKTQGRMVEVGCGPGGGITPRVLLDNRDCRIIMNDISNRILQLQRDQMKKEGVGSNVIFMAYDMMKKVLRPETVDAVSSFGGFGETGGKADMAISVAYDALVPGGLLYVSELDHDSDEYRALPDDIKTRFGLTEGWRARLERAGFEITQYAATQGELMDDPEDGGLAKAVMERGITLHKNHAQIIARKPGRGSLSRAP